MGGEQQEPRRLIRSYQAAFRFELLLYNFGTWRLPRPVPARGVLYAAVVWPAMLLLGQLPLIGAVLARFGWLMAYVAIPLVVTMLLTVADVQGRRFHLALQAWWRHWCSARHLAGGYRAVGRPGGSWRPARIVFVSDGRCGLLPHGTRLEGPGRVLLRYPCEAIERGRALTVQQISGAPCTPGKVVEIADGAAIRLTGVTEGSTRGRRVRRGTRV
jgi:hypothetical protein